MQGSQHSHFTHPTMKSFSFVAVLLLALVLGIASGFVVPSPAALNVRQSRTVDNGMRMLFGLGGGKKQTATKTGVVIKVICDQVHL